MRGTPSCQRTIHYVGWRSCSGERRPPVGGSIDQRGVNENGFWLKLAFLSLLELELKVQPVVLQARHLFDLIDFESTPACKMAIANGSSSAI